MGREVRKVPANWEHPKDEMGRYIPLYDNFVNDMKQFFGRVSSNGLSEALEYYGGSPKFSKYMHPEGERTHYMMYETTSEGTPISPAFATPEELARWLADTGASAFGSLTATYQDWLSTTKHGSAVGLVYTPSTGVVSGVEFQGGIDEEIAPVTPSGVEGLEEVI